jgi:hypothetical protein
VERAAESQRMALEAAAASERTDARLRVLEGSARGFSAAAAAAAAAAAPTSSQDGACAPPAAAGSRPGSGAGVLSGDGGSAGGGDAHRRLAGDLQALSRRVTSCEVAAGQAVQALALVGRGSLLP